VRVALIFLVGLERIVTIHDFGVSGQPCDLRLCPAQWGLVIRLRMQWPRALVVIVTPVLDFIGEGVLVVFHAPHATQVRGRTSTLRRRKCSRWRGLRSEAVFPAGANPQRDGITQVRAAVFVRYAGAFGLGHVGWAFDCDAQLADCGAIEDPGSDPIVQPVDMGFWTDTSIDPVPFAIDRKYDEVKYVDLETAAPAAAYGTVLWVAAQRYIVVTRDCLDDVYDVLTSYGVPNLPPPAHTWAPNQWFAQFDGTQLPITQFHWRSTRPPGQVDSMSRLPSRAQALRNLSSGAPPWRIEGTPESATLQQRISDVEAGHPPDGYGNLVPH